MTTAMKFIFACATFAIAATLIVDAVSACEDPRPSATYVGLRLAMAEDSQSDIVVIATEPVPADTLVRIQ